jgi:hypothetical protein
MSNFTESLHSCGGDQLYQKYHSDAVITDLLDDDDYVLPDGGVYVIINTLYMCHVMMYQ